MLAEIPDEWAAAAEQLLTLAPVPNRAFGYLLWQTFTATGLIDSERMHAFAEKAMREAADGTGWIDPDVEFEQAVHTAVDAAYTNPTVTKLINDLHQLITPYGWVNSLSQKLIQLTMPGVPDVYQGSELWEDSLVDPDNRRPIDFAERATVLEGLLAAGDPPKVDDTAHAKLWLVAHALRTRRDHPNLFTDYRPLTCDGPLRDHLVAFDRGGAITLATRLPAGLAEAGGWGDTTVLLPARSYLCALTDTAFVGGPTRVADLFATYPVALLTEGTS